MWSRILIAVLGVWLLASPVVFDHPPGDMRSWLIDAASGAVAIICSLTRIAARPWQIAGVMLVLGSGLIGAAYLDFANPTAAAQNRAMVGLLIMMCGLAPASGDWTGSVFERWERQTAGGQGLATRSGCLLHRVWDSSARWRAGRRGSDHRHGGFGATGFEGWSGWHNSRL